jgi:hypothetical protein
MSFDFLIFVKKLKEGFVKINYNSLLLKHSFLKEALPLLKII